MVRQHQANRLIAQQAARRQEEEKCMSPKHLLIRAMVKSKQASPNPLAADKSTMAIKAVDVLAQDRIKTTAEARRVGSLVQELSHLEDENGALLAISEKLTGDLALSKCQIDQMSQQLVALQKRAREEHQNRETLIKLDAQKLNDEIVTNITSRDQELTAIRRQIDEITAQTQKLHALGSPAQFRDGFEKELHRSIPDRRDPAHPLKRSMLLDV
jgi:chromosome segregation ATPase